MSACGSHSEQPISAPVQAEASVAQTSVAAEQQPLLGTLASKGVIQSEVDVPVYSLLTSIVTELNAKEGQEVREGQLLAKLNQYEIEEKLERVNNEIASARFQYETILVGQGYDPKQSGSIPQSILEAARIRSSLSYYETELELLNKQLDFTYIKAPVKGILTDVVLHKHDLAQQGTPLCRIIDPENLRVQFTILESEISKFSVGTEVKVCTMAYPNEYHSATVTSISPKVESNGMIRIKAKLLDHEHLMAGMTAIVTL